MSDSRLEYCKILSKNTGGSSETSLEVLYYLGSDNLLNRGVQFSITSKADLSSLKQKWLAIHSRLSMLQSIYHLKKKIVSAMFRKITEDLTYLMINGITKTMFRKMTEHIPNKI